MKNNSIIFLFLISINFVAAQDYNNWHKNYLEVGLTGGTYSNTGGNMGGYGCIGFFFESFGKQSSVDLRAKEVYITSPQREAGCITVTYRLYLNKGFYVGGGFAHNHEVPINDFIDQPVGALLGNGKAIIHRTGGALELGYDFHSLVEKIGLYPTTNFCFTYLALDNEPNPYFNLSLGLRFGVKKQ